jgi:hypothetical protein
MPTLADDTLTLKIIKAIKAEINPVVISTQAAARETTRSRLKMLL